MPKKDLIRRIDHIDERDNVQVPQPGDHVHADTEYGMTPSVGRSKRYSRMDHSHGTPEERLWGTSGKVQIVGGLFGSMVNGAQSVAYTNLKADAIAYNKLQAVCEPAAPTGGITVSVLGNSLTISAAATASSVTTLSPAGSLASGASLTIVITALTGTYTGTICVMVADGT